MAAYLVCIKHWHSLVPEHVADRALAHACGAGHGVKKDLNFAPFHIASQRSSTVTHLCFQSAPEAGASWSRTSRTITFNHRSFLAWVTTASDACGNGHLRSGALHETTSVVAGRKDAV